MKNFNNYLVCYFSNQEFALIRRLISENPSASRAALSRLICQALDWYKIDGGLKEMSCRGAMLRMHDDSLIKLSAARHRYCPATNVQFTSATSPKPKINKPVHALPSVQLRIVRGKQQSRLWNEYIHRYHYLGYKPLPGAQLRYFVICENNIIASHATGRIIMDTNRYYWRPLLKGIALWEPVTKLQTGYWLAKQKVEENLAQQEKSVS